MLFAKFITIPYQHIGSQREKFGVSSFSLQAIFPGFHHSYSHFNSSSKCTHEIPYASPPPCLRPFLSSLLNKYKVRILPQELVECNTGYISPAVRDLSYNPPSSRRPDQPMPILPQNCCSSELIQFYKCSHRQCYGSGVTPCSQDRPHFWMSFVLLFCFLEMLIKQSRSFL